MHNSKSFPSLTGDGVVRELEHRFAELLEGRLRCLSVVNATSGLAAVLSGLPKGRVLTTLFTSPATYAAIRHSGHDVTFCDIDPISLCLSPTAVQREINSDVRAIVTVNIFGHWSDLAALRQLAGDIGGLLILDAAQSLATCLSNPEYTNLADVTVFSLGPNKWMGAPDGGLLAVRSPHLWETLVLATQHELRQILDVPEQALNFEHFNYRINPYTAAEVLTGLQDIERKIANLRQDQQKLLKQLTIREDIEPLPSEIDIIFEPLTVLPIGTKLKHWNLHNLPIPARLQVAQEYRLSETLRQFQNRKVVGLPIARSRDVFYRTSQNFTK